jgi:hypothetical protein
MTTPPLEEPPAGSSEPANAEAAEPATTGAPPAGAEPPVPAPAAAEPSVPQPANAQPANAQPPVPASANAEPAVPAPANAVPAVTGSTEPVPDPDIGELVELNRSTVTVARYADYAGAQQAVDYLSDNGFPVQRTALAGVASGAWFGLFVGILFTLFSNSNWLGILVTTILVGALWGGVFGAIAHALTGGRRDFTSRSSLQAGQYAVTVEAEVADEARVLITRQNWRAAN